MSVPDLIARFPHIDPTLLRLVALLVDDRPSPDHLLWLRDALDECVECCRDEGELQMAEDIERLSARVAEMDGRKAICSELRRLAHMVERGVPARNATDA